MKELLSQENVSFEEVDVSQNPDAVQELVELTGEMKVPVVRKGDNFVIGADKEKIKELVT
ncbi:Glutaredoxin [Natranaerofaba carboxydovora]|nr:glutaredoxin family protein [Natranaerofaba carboxydovora]UMZ72753.1 Glutaredoxin [Natranaerofaba carboxydovora]